jgi:hypothetical protein
MKLGIVYPSFVFQPIRDIVDLFFRSFYDSDVEVEAVGVETSKDLDLLAQSGIYTHMLCINVHDFLEKEKNFFLRSSPATCLMAYNLEQTPIEHQNSGWSSMRLNQVGFYGPYFDYIVTESTAKLKDLTAMGFRTLILELPYHSNFDISDPHTLEEKKYDFCFFGCGSDRRMAVVQKLQQEGFTFAPMNTMAAMHGEYKAQMIRQSRICLNIHYSDMEYFEKPRLKLDFFINRGVVVSEKILYPEHFQHMKHLYMSKYPNIIPLSMVLLHKYNEDMLAVGEEGYKCFKEFYDYRRVIPNFMEELYNAEMMYGRLVR